MLWRRGVDRPVMPNVVVKQWKEADVHTGSGQLCMEIAWRRWMPREERTVAAQNKTIAKVCTIAARESWIPDETLGAGSHSKDQQPQECVRVALVLHQPRLGLEVVGGIAQVLRLAGT